MYSPIPSMDANAMDASFDPISYPFFRPSCLAGSSRPSTSSSSPLPLAESHSPTPLFQLAKAPRAAKTITTTAATPLDSLSTPLTLGPVTTTPLTLLSIAAASVALYGLKRLYDTPSRSYDGNVGDEYDAWTQEGILEYYWGEHIHLGYYNEEERRRGYLKKNFIQAKYDFVDEMFNWSGSRDPPRVLDVGCGIGGTTRHLAKRFPSSQLLGITLSPRQVERATQLAKDKGLSNVKFQVTDALNMPFPDNSFDLVWACESGEHMPDKKRYVDEMTRVLKPGGTIVIATWCQREETSDKPLSEEDKKDLQFLYEEWAHPYFVSIEEYGRLMKKTNQLDRVETADWTVQTIDSWRHSIWVGVFDPWIVIRKGPKLWYKVTREIVTLERMHRAFDKGLMTYGMMKAVKK